MHSKIVEAIVENRRNGKQTTPELFLRAVFLEKQGCFSGKRAPTTDN
jgi:hypothetical protein